MIDLPIAEYTVWYKWFWNLLNWVVYLLQDIEEIWSAMNVPFDMLDTYLLEEYAIDAKWIDLFTGALDSITEVFGFSISTYSTAELIIGGGFFIVFLLILIKILKGMVSFLVSASS